MFNYSSPSSTRDTVLFDSSISVKHNDDNRNSNLRLQITRAPECLSFMYPSKGIRIQLSDDNDPFVAYSADFNEESFQRLKVQQQLLVDFSSFPQRLVDLLKMCGGEDAATSRYQAELRSERMPPSASLDITEINGFRKILHLSIRLNQADEASLKQHLRTTIQRLQNERIQYEASLKTLESKLAEQQAIYERQMEQLARKFEQEMQFKSRQDVQQRFERFGQAEFEATVKERIKTMETKLQSTDALNATLETRLREMEGETQQVLMQLTQERETNRIMQDRLECLQRTDPGRDNADLRLKVAQMKVEVETLKTDLCRSQMENKRLEEAVQHKHGQLDRREAGIKTMSEDILKANDIIQKLQAELKTYHSKMKVRSDVIMKQEEIIESKEKELQSLRRGTGSTDNGKIQQLEKQVEHKDNVIQWLNKKLNEFQGHKVDTPLMAAPLNERNGQTRPIGSGRHLSNRPD